MERRELLRIAASLGAVGVAGRFVTACTNPVITPPLPTTTVDPNATTTTTAAPPTVPPPSGYGALAAPDANGVRVPSGFTSRIIATSGQAVGGTGYVWHPNPDGGACFAVAGGGWVYVSNSESAAGSGGGVSMVRFAADGSIVEARRILANTTRN